MHIERTGQRKFTPGRVVPAAVLVIALAGAGCGSPGIAVPPATEYVVSGTILGADGSPLASASVVFTGSPRGALADEQGRFTVSGIYPGSYGVTILHLGFRSEAGRIRIPGAGHESLELPMHRDPGLSQGLVGRIPDSMEPVSVTLEVRPGS